MTAGGLTFKSSAIPGQSGAAVGGGNPNVGGPAGGPMGMQQNMDAMPPRHEQDKNHPQALD